jgi:hypothetical protein
MAPLPQWKQLTDAERGQIVGMWQCGKTFAAIGWKLELNCDMERKVWNYWETMGNIIPPP